MNNKETSASGCLFTVLTFAAILTLSFNAILQLVFLVFKATDVVAWAWLWVLAPTWIPLMILSALAVATLL